MSFAGFFEASKKRKAEQHRDVFATTIPPSSASSRSTPAMGGAKKEYASGPLSAASPRGDKVSDKKPSPSKARRRDGENSSSGRKRNRSQHRRPRPSQEALDLSSQLKELSNQKNLQQALLLYSKSSKIRDEYHTCIMIDCCVRCGSIEEAERLFHQHAGKANVEMYTALLKGYAHSGKMHKADKLFEEMFDHEVLPNVRTLNTFLRGCLWSAATESQGIVSGGVVSSEKAWRLFREKVGAVSLDSSSYEYTITLLCQALDVDEAGKRLDEYQTRNQVRFKGKASVVGGDQAVLETLAVAYLSLSRAFALLGRVDDTWLSCQRVLNCAKGSIALLKADSTSETTKPRRTKIGGGKKSWSSGTVDPMRKSRREESNLAYRTHRLSEVELEARKILQHRGRTSTPIPAEVVHDRLSRKLIYLAGGGTTELNQGDSRRDASIGAIECSSVNVTRRFSFGAEKLIAPKKGRSSTSVFKNGVMDFRAIFGDDEKPVDVELGAGFGDWITSQAEAEPSRNYVAVELRADRVYQIFSRSTIVCAKPLDNVCVVGSDAGRFLGSFIQPKTCSSLYVLHPEPPTQTYGSDWKNLKRIMTGDTEPAHLLTSETIISAAKALIPGGKLIVVTDNRSYSRLLAATLVKVVRFDRTLFCTPSQEELDRLRLRLLENFQDGVTLYQSSSSTVGQQTSSTEHGTTWFDRLWKTGAGSHAQTETRFVIAMYRR